ncbi:MAG: dihydrolipoamide acetyltransferase family protein [Pirellulales bacterium]
MPHEITIPRLGWSMEEAIFVGWLKEPGVWVEAGEVLFTLETDKATQEIESLDSGVLHLAADAPQPGENVLVGRVIGVLAGKGESVAGFSEPSRHAQPAAKTSESKRSALTSPATSGDAADELPSAQPAMPSPAAHSRTQDRAATPAMRRAQRAVEMNAANARTMTAGKVRASNLSAVTPRARRAARELRIATDQLTGTGRGGRIRERDVRQAAANGAGAKSTAHAKLAGAIGGSKNIRAAIARRLVAGLHSMAPVTLTSRADATNLVNLRAQFQADADANAVPSLTDFVVKLVALSLGRHPLLNASWADDRVVENQEIAIGVAVDTPAGLLVPVLRDVASSGVREIAERSRDLFDRARAGRLTARELEGGTFTISNLGMLGIDAFTPIINPPQAAVVGIGAIRREPVYQPDGTLAPRELTTLSLTFDHRVVDGAPAARFLQTVVAAIENPAPWLTP